MNFVPDSELRSGYRCCKSCERIMPTVYFEEYGRGHRRICMDCRAISQTMQGWLDEEQIVPPEE